MARKAKPSSRTLIRYISADDSAIGLEPEALAEAYQKYMQNLDETTLQIIPGEIPSYYHLKVLPLDLHAKMVDALRTDEETTPLEVFLSPVGRELLTEFLTRCLVAVDAHPYIDRINPDGSFVENVISWPVGGTRPPGLVEAILGEEHLAINLFWFGYRASQLTDDEKKP